MKNKQSVKQKTPACVGNKCYKTITHTITVKIIYADNITEDCPVIQPKNEAQYVKQARGALYSFAVTHCAFGDENKSKSACGSPCECKPQFSDIKTETLGTGKLPDTNKCYVSIKVTGTISCKCEY